MATAWALERLGFACLVFEQGAPGGAQSGGESRIFRHGHADSRQFELARQARRDWQDWEEEFGVQLISEDGAMVTGQEAVTRLARYADEPGMDVREIGPGDIAQYLPPMTSYGGPAKIDGSAGSIRSQLALANLIAAVGLNLVPEKVIAVEPRIEGGVSVTSSFGPRNFDAVVVAAGTGTSELAEGAGVRIPLETRAHVRLTMPLRDGGFARQLACLQDSSGAFGEAAAYGSPVTGNREYAVGLPITVPIEPEAGGRDLLDALALRTSEYVDLALPGLDTSRAVALERWVTELPWASDGLGIWQAGDAYFVAGHNLFKLAPALGRALARAVVAGEVEPGLRPEDRLGLPDSETPESAPAA